MIIDVIISLCPCFESFLLNPDNLFTETAPEVGFTVSTHTAVFQFLLDSLAREVVNVCEVLLECFSAVAGFAAHLCWSVRCPEVAFPDLQKEVLAILVALPVILTAESFVAAFIGTTVGFLVPLHMFPV